MSNTLTLTFTGDIGFDHYMANRFRDENLLSGDVKDFLLSTDHLIVNVEGALSDSKITPPKNGVAALAHSMPAGVIDFLSSIHADILNLANNHIMDAGAEGLNDTLLLAHSHHMETIGAGMNIDEAAKPLILEGAGGIGIFAVGYQRACRKADETTAGCLSWSDMERISANIRKIKSKCRWCIVVSHGGEEFTSLPAPYTRDRYLEYLDMGADLVVAHHPHVPMNYEILENGKGIFYSLGNFIFDTDYQRAQFNTEKGILLKLTLSETDWSFKPLGIKVNRDKEIIESACLPLIFENVTKEDYDLLIPLSSKAFLEATKKQQIFLKPDKYSASTTDAEWHENFYEEKRSGRVPGEALDLQIIVPIAEKEKEKAWKKSGLTNVVKYITEQL